MSYKCKMATVIEKALKTRVSDSIKDEIAQVLEVKVETMTAKQAVAYAQIVKAIKGDKSAFEAINNVVKLPQVEQDKAVTVEVKVVE